MERLLALAVITALMGCDRTPRSELTVAAAWDTAAWRVDLATRAAERSEWVASAFGPLAQVALCRIEPARLPQEIGSDATLGCRIPGENIPAQIGSLIVIGDTLTLVGDAPISWRGGESLGGRHILAIREQPRAGGAEAWQGAVRVTARWADGAITLWGLDTLAAARDHFAGITRWPADPDWRTPARFEAAHDEWRLVPTVRGFDLPREIAGTVIADIGGETRHLTAYSKGLGATSMLVVIHDLTSGDGSYPAGRFVDVPFADSLGRTVLDFNLARNPDCAFTLSSPCPLPPRENWFEQRIEVGEQVYAKP